MTVTIWHNPRCTKSRQALAIVEEIFQNEEIVVRKYLDDPPTTEELEAVLTKLGFDSAGQIVRRSEKAFKELDLENASDSTILAALSEHPSLIERAIVIFGENAVVGRPPENVHRLRDET